MVPALLQDEYQSCRAVVLKSVSNIFVLHPARRHILYRDDCKNHRDMVALAFWNVEFSFKNPFYRRFDKEVKTIGDHVRKRRIELGLFQKAVALKLKVSEDAVTYWENNRAIPMIHFSPSWQPSKHQHSIVFQSYYSLIRLDIGSILFFHREFQHQSQLDCILERK